MKNLSIGKKDLISRIIIENYESFLEKYSTILTDSKISHIRATCEKLKSCKDIKHGYTEYICPDCYKSIKIGFSCKSKFCTSCSQVYSDNWIDKQNELLLNVKHRHMVFTIPDKFRKLIYNNLYLIKEFNNICCNVILGALNSGYKRAKDKKKFLSKTKGITKPAIISVLHTFGRDLKFNPHFHLIVAEGGFRNDGSFKKCTYFEFELLREAWRKLFLDKIKEKFGHLYKFRKLINKYYNDYQGFYVRAIDIIYDFEKINKYLGRYLSRPPFSSKNIIKYDKKAITFKYKDYKADKEIIETLPTLKFLGKLFYHLLPKNFRTIRRFGAYARNLGKKFVDIIEKMRLRAGRLFSKNKLTYLEKLKTAFGHNLLKCKQCNSMIELYLIWHPKQGVIFSLEMLPSI